MNDEKPRTTYLPGYTLRARIEGEGAVKCMSHHESPFDVFDSVEFKWNVPKEYSMFKGMEAIRENCKKLTSDIMVTVDVEGELRVMTISEYVTYCGHYFNFADRFITMQRGEDEPYVSAIYDYGNLVLVWILTKEMV